MLFSCRHSTEFFLENLMRRQECNLSMFWLEILCINGKFKGILRKWELYHPGFSIPFSYQLDLWAWISLFTQISGIVKMLFFCPQLLYQCNVEKLLRECLAQETWVNNFLSCNNASHHHMVNISRGMVIVIYCLHCRERPLLEWIVYRPGWLTCMSASQWKPSHFPTLCI